jgi:hypothetical protein
MDILQAETRKKKKIGKVTETTIKLTRRDDKPISMALAKQTIEGLIDRTHKNNGKILVRALNAEKWTTLKGFDTDFDEDNYDEYYENRVQSKDIDKFKEFSQLEITIVMQK